jgi:uncharacterized repeat protein (TIGR03803 family)
MNCFQCDSRFSIPKALPVAALVAVVAVMTLAFAPAAYAQTYTIVHSFAGGATDAAAPNGELIQDAAGNLYGTSYEGGAYNYGTVFKLDPSGVVTILHSFNAEIEPTRPVAGLFRDPEGNFYGTTPNSVFMLDTNNVVTTLSRSSGSNFKLVSVDGVLYSTTWGAACGTIFSVRKNGKEKVVHTFSGPDGCAPQGLIRDSAGNFYGATEMGGAGCISSYGCGTIFKLDTTGVFSVLYSFTGGADGAHPSGRLIRDGKGNIHGVTTNGGDPACNCGVVFRLDADGNETVARTFFGYKSGGAPSLGVLDVGGTLYGTTNWGGDYTCNTKGCGVLYQISKTGKYTVLHIFGGPAAGDGFDGETDELTLGTDGSIYGATYFGGTGCASGGPDGCGTIFKYTPASPVEVHP